MNKEEKNSPPAKITEAVGKREHPAGGGGVWAAVLIALGVILLLNNLGILSWTVWTTLLQFWPILLILGGLQLILGRSFFFRLLMTIVTLAAIAFVLVLALAPQNPGLENWLQKTFPNWRKIEFPQEKFQEEELEQITLPLEHGRVRIYRYQ